MPKLQTSEELKIDITVNPKTYNFLRDCKKRKLHLFGGAGSGKSWSIAQFLIVEKMLNEHDIRIVITRKTGPALMKSAWLLVLDLLKAHNIPHDKNITDRLITIGSNEMYFVALDDPEKLKSFEKINYIWAEEATELFWDDYKQLGLRCRGHNPNGMNQLYFSYNPILKPFNKYLQKITENPPENTAVLHTTYHDNAFLDPEYIAEIEALEQEDETYWLIYGLGKWAIAKNIVYTNWDIIPIEEWDFEAWRNTGYGLDFGFNAPSALIEIRIKEKDGVLETFERELLFERKLTNAQIIERLEELIPDKYRERIIVADCAEPDRILEIQQAGYNCWPCSKGPHSRRIGIDRAKRFRAHISSDSVNLIDEISTYKWKEDFNGEPLDVPVDYNDHTMDARRYYLGEIKFEEIPELTVLGEFI
jgi:phage terminase large subunit